MTSQTPPLNIVDSLVADIVSVIDLLDSIPLSKDDSLDRYKTACLNIPDQLRSGRLKVAVVGVIKSGKSTFINSLLKKELVKRGAGVVTAITTRIRKGKKNRAVISLKSWDEINQILEKNLDMFPESGPNDSFDIRRKKDREYLARVYETLEKEFPVTSDGIRPETLIIRNALDGFDHCQHIIEADEQQIFFEGKSFGSHKIYTADAAKAFYVKDVCLEVFGKGIEPGLEIADCQGADSTDPAQLAQILSYIEGANLIVYCISSRTGLRQSDMGFLKNIKRLGLMDNILFVNNCDLTEHDHLKDLKGIEEKIEKELRLFTSTPKLYTFSALFNLFDNMKSLSKKNSGRLSLWKDESAMIGFCSQNTLAFHKTYSGLLEQNRYQLLFSNHLERIRLTARVLNQKCDLISGMLVSDLDGQTKAKAQLKEIEENAQRLRIIVDNSIQGAVSGLTREIESNLKKAFLKDSININNRVSSFIKEAKMDVSPYRAGVKETGFKQIIYLMFQDFKRRLDLFAVEEIIPEVKEVVGAQEKRIETYFQSLLDSYQIDFLTIGSRMGKDAQQFSLQLFEKDPATIKAVDIGSIKKILGLTPPDQIFSARFTTKMRANALTDLGFHSFILFISALLDKHVRFSFTPGFDKAALKIKKESLNIVRQQIKTYHLTLRQEYFLPLIEAATRDFKEKILQRFTLYETLNNDMEEIFKFKKEEKEAQKEKIGQARASLDSITHRLENFSFESSGSEG